VEVRTDPYLLSEVKYGRHLAYSKINIPTNSIFFSKSERYAFFNKNLTNGLVADTNLKTDERTDGWKTCPNV
jgi:hypothetical protein